MASCHGKVRKRGKDDNHGGDDVVDALADWDAPSQTSEDDGGDDHEDEDDPTTSVQSSELLITSSRAGSHTKESSYQPRRQPGTLASWGRRLEEERRGSSLA